MLFVLMGVGVIIFWIFIIEEISHPSQNLKSPTPEDDFFLMLDFDDLDGDGWLDWNDPDVDGDGIMNWEDDFDGGW